MQPRGCIYVEHGSDRETGHAQGDAARVWKALTDATEFGKWFGVNIEGPFVPGQTARGTDHQPEVRRTSPRSSRSSASSRNRTFPIDGIPTRSIRRSIIRRSRRRWSSSVSKQEGPATVLTIVESGFDRIPLARRAEAFKMNDGGWTGQIKNIEKHVGQA